MVHQGPMPRILADDIGIMKETLIKLDPSLVEGSYVGIHAYAAHVFHAFIA